RVLRDDLVTAVHAPRQVRGRRASGRKRIEQIDLAAATVLDLQRGSVRRGLRVARSDRRSAGQRGGLLIGVHRPGDGVALVLERDAEVQVVLGLAWPGGQALTAHRDNVHAALRVLSGHVVGGGGERLLRRLCVRNIGVRVGLVVGLVRATSGGQGEGQ